MSSLRQELIARGLDLDAINDIEAHIRGLDDGAASYPTPAHGWTCFHCGETFWTEPGARLHFGPTPGGRPMCIAAGALNDIHAERRRQINEEGWTAELDDDHGDGSLALAAACYAMFASASDDARDGTALPASLATAGKDIPGWSAWLDIWPWDRRWWKPKDRRRDLVRSGALIVAEIERLDRQAV